MFTPNQAMQLQLQTAVETAQDASVADDALMELFDEYDALVEVREAIKHSTYDPDIVMEEVDRLNSKIRAMKARVERVEKELCGVEA